MKNIYKFYQCLFLLLIFSGSLVAQNNSEVIPGKTIKVAAGAEYKRSSFYQSFWGRNYRKEWTTPVTFPITMMDTLKGGIVKYKIGGGHQSKSLHLKNKQDKEFALRSVNKSLKVLIPPIFRNTFVEHIANDEISMSHPYGALGVPIMAKAAGIPYTTPQFLWVPKQSALDTLNNIYGDRLYLFEQRASGDWSNANNFLNFNKFIGSDELMEKIYEDNDRHIDRNAFVKARLFDMVIGDWDRHLDQWKWGKKDSGDQTIYVPIPTDRDQAFSTNNGWLLKIAIAASGQKYLQPFGYTIQDVTITEKRFLDRLLTNQVTLGQWLTQAKNIKDALTDNVIETSIKQMPAEIFAISGNEIIAKLKSRRDHLEEYATKYYNFLAKEVEVVGTKSSEYFEVKSAGDNQTEVSVFNINKEGKKENKTFYSRVFKNDETKEIRLYGLSGEDVYNIQGNSGIKIRIIGGDEKDSVINNSNTKIHFYDDEKNNYVSGSKIRRHELEDSMDHTYDYNTYLYDKKGLRPLLGYSNDDRFFVGIGYGITHHKWRRPPFAYKQEIGARYSISQKAVSVFYNGLFPHTFGKTDVILNADYDAIRWINFYGLGNETMLTTQNIKFNRTQTKEITGDIGLQRKFGKNTINLLGFFQSVKIINDTGRFVAKSVAPSQPDIYKTNNYAGAQLNYKFSVLNDSIVPTSGFYFAVNASHFQNITQTNQSFQKYSGVTQVYIPLVSKFSIAIRAAAGTITGNPLFYQYPHIGGADDMRGYRRERFWGKTVFSNSNELRFITNFRTSIVNGKIGLVAFYDQGRVWQPLETSNTWHTDYGGGLILAPFNKLLANIAYGISKEKSVVQLRIIKSF